MEASNPRRMEVMAAPRKYPDEVRERAIRPVRELGRANAILKTASAFFAAELDRPSPR